MTASKSSTASHNRVIDALEARAKKIIAGEACDLDQALQVAEGLRKRTQFGLARRVLERLGNEDDMLRRDTVRFRQLRQRLALCTYNDPDLDPECKLDDALAILETCADLRTTDDPESLGLAGAIWKRKWEQDASLAHLERALSYYQRGHVAGMEVESSRDETAPLHDHYAGYAGINAAFVLDLIAYQETQAADGCPHPIAQGRRAAAQKIRQELVQHLEHLQKTPTYAEEFARSWWLIVTLAEAYFGLQDFPAAHLWLRKARARIEQPEQQSPVAEWEQETTARQLASLALLQGSSETRGQVDLLKPSWAALAELVPNVQALRGIVIGKMGLALSGGGFRASLFHIGVLARLAELDVLRHVDSLSCVSGGSIIGAYYYLKLQQLLEAVPDEQITQAHYVELVREIEREFLAGVQRNVRMRIFCSWWDTVKMLFSRRHSPTMRLGELYERELYQRAYVQTTGQGAELTGARASKEPPYWINDLKMTPCGEAQEFSPKIGNWRRGTKVPMLILNATSLNTGHNWQFTATYMGESPAAISRNIDCNYRLRRMYYEDAPQAWQRVRLGHAVAASSCVPGLFQPLVLDRLYIKPAALDTDTPRQDCAVSVRLVDGGVYDNQGTAALIEQGCSVLLVCDASGQSESEDAPPLSLLGVPMRTMGLLQQRIRIAQYNELAARRRAALLRELMFIHMRQDLDGAALDWIECQDPVSQPQPHPVTSYGISKDIQRQLSAIRTDLDSFTDVEAAALMASGYHMADKACPNILRAEVDALNADGAAPQWIFMDRDLEPHLSKPSSTQAEIRRQLAASTSIPFKIWKLSRALRALSWIIGVMVLLAAAVLAHAYWYTNLGASVGELVGIAVLALIGCALGPWATRVLNYHKALYQAVSLLVLALGGALVVRLHLMIFDRLFLKHGSLARLKRKSRGL